MQHQTDMSINTTSSDQTSSTLPSPHILSSPTNWTTFNLGPLGSYTITITNITHLVSLKLDRTNYPLWRALFLHVLYSQGLMGFIDGSIQPPPPHLSQESTSTTIEPSNPAFLAWLHVDQTIQSWIMATLSLVALGTVLGLRTAHQMWSHLQHQFASNIQARLLQLKFELQHIKKGTLTMAEYLDKVKQIADDLATASKPVDHDDLVFFTLGSLGPEFETLAMTVTPRTTPITIEELHTVLLTQEHRLSITSHMASLDLTPSSPAANLASRSSDSRGQGRGRGQGHGRGRGHHTNYGGRGSSSSSTVSASSSNGTK